MTTRCRPLPSDLLDLSRGDLAAWLVARGLPAWRAAQVLRWVYARGVTDFGAMTDLSRELRGLLAEHFRIAPPEIRERLVAADGTEKFLFGLEDGEAIEGVLLPERGHFTLCVSSQAGCAQGCRFCLTGRGGFRRNLRPAEILGQVLAVRRAIPEPGRLTNLVFMGMGEPLANLENLLQALSLLTDAEVGMGFAARRITVSTAGLVPQMPAFGRASRVSLAVSLNAADDETRSRLMPVNRRWPLAELLEACRRYPLPPGRRLTFEYILIRDVNDSPADARRLCRLLAPIRCKVNLIPFNPHPGCAFARPAEERILAFQKVLLEARLTAIIRRSKGEDILAACGQLRGQRAPAAGGG
ncbi:MAG: 23S rRNA (adenine(2503)-C(2))-methyltransferase RlmN [Desulfobacterales bacterium]